MQAKSQQWRGNCCEYASTLLYSHCRNRATHTEEGASMNRRHVRVCCGIVWVGAKAAPRYCHRVEGHCNYGCKNVTIGRYQWHKKAGR